MTNDEFIYYLRMGCNLQQKDGERAAKLIESLQHELQICRMAQVVMDNTVKELEDKLNQKDMM